MMDFVSDLTDRLLREANGPRALLGGSPSTRGNPDHGGILWHQSCAVRFSEFLSMEIVY